MNAMRLIERKLLGYSQHVAMIMARKTPAEAGELAITLDDLQRITGWSRPTLIGCIQEICAAGLMEKQRRGSVANVYRWTEAAYTDVPVGRTPENR